MVASGDAGGGLSAFFNRGTLMSQIVQPFRARRHQRRVTARVSQEPGNARLPGAHYLSGDALQSILTFLHDADQRGSSIRAAIYEMNDQELIDALKPFGNPWPRAARQWWLDAADRGAGADSGQA